MFLHSCFSGEKCLRSLHVQLESNVELLSIQQCNSTMKAEEKFLPFLQQQSAMVTNLEQEEKGPRKAQIAVANRVKSNLYLKYNIYAIHIEKRQLLVASISLPLGEVTIETVTEETIKGNKNGRGGMKIFENLK